MTLQTAVVRTSKLIAALALASTACATALAAPSVSLSPLETTVYVGDTFSLQVKASDITEGIGAWDFLPTFTASGVASLETVSFSNALGSITGGEAISFKGTDFGVTSLLSTSALLALQGSSATLATLSFKALAQGTTFFSFDAPRNGVLLADAAGLEILSPTVGTAKIVVMVPEPSTYALFLAGAGLIAVALRRRKQSGSDSA